MSVARVPGRPVGGGGSRIDYLAHNRGAEEIPPSQFNTVESTNEQLDSKKWGLD